MMKEFHEINVMNGVYTINGSIDACAAETDTEKVYNAEIYDFGNRQTSMLDFTGFDKIYVVGGTSWNELPMIYDAQTDLNKVNYSVVVNFSDEATIEKYRGILSVNLNDVICLPFEPDPFEIGKYEEIFDNDFAEWADSPIEETEFSAEK